MNKKEKICTVHNIEKTKYRDGRYWVWRCKKCVKERLTKYYKTEGYKEIIRKRGSKPENRRNYYLNLKNNRREVYREMIKRKRKRMSLNITDRYVIEIIKKRIKLPTKTIRNNPELMENCRLELKLKRLIKQKKHGKNTKTG